jgi:hypothetical protein
MNVLPSIMLGFLLYVSGKTIASVLKKIRGF